MNLHNKFNILLIALSGAAFLIFGVWLLIYPLEGLASFGLNLAAEPAHRIEVRAFYGGLEIGLGVLLLKFAFSAHYRRAGLWLVVASYGALAAARIVGILAENGAIPQMAWVALAVELVLGALGLAALLMSPRGEPS